MSKAIIAKVHYYSVWIFVARVSYNEPKDHSDGHYCLVSVKGAKQFTQTFADISVIILQDNKSKIGLDVFAVERTFYTLQSMHKLVQISNHDFIHGSNQKLVPLVYLIIKSSEINNALRTRQIAIFVRS
ncbi:24556_t:CDS:2 [Gigaspora margarita]|uniref:24556_t:CDS:1 n=1 Tax=Gigaspora margarita TaxID=4874 RepID=A0ABN7V8R4_GIGMA|nr:24556_t:CDS:2 [Gigaspora margarita]